MSERKEYKVGEIFRHYENTFQCVENPKFFTFEEACSWLSDSICWAKNRSDGKDVHYIQVNEPEEGMLFRASDGKLYELKNVENRGCGCYLYGYMSCSEIDKEAFGEITKKEFHWYPVEEKEEEKEMIDYSKIELQKIYMKRHLELADVCVKNNIVKFRVADQFYFGDEFSAQLYKHEFTAKNGLIIRLGEKLEWDEFNEILSLRRFLNINTFEETIECNVHHFADIMEAINEYNETNGKGYEKPWPQNGDWYFYVASDGEVGHFKYDPEKYTHRRMEEIGNLFRTREEAEAALERVKKALKGE